jgi:hypothetical protein
MRTIGNNQRPAILVKNALSTTLHLIVGRADRGIVLFACEQAPLTTFQSYGFPRRCPICQKENPIRDEQESK